MIHIKPPAAFLGDHDEGLLGGVLLNWWALCRVRALQASWMPHGGLFEARN
jgi:hypothetical protein